MQEEQLGEIEIPNIEGKSLKEAESIIKENQLQLIISNEQDEINKETTLVKEQTPKAGIKVKPGTNIYVEFE